MSLKHLLRLLPLIACCLSSHANESKIRISTIGANAMPVNIVVPGYRWNFGRGALRTFNGWQYAAYWDDARQISIARRELPEGEWAVLSLPGYQRSETGNRGFGDGHEKAVLGISPDGVIHLAFDHHVDTLHYRSSLSGIALNPAQHEWNAQLFGPVQDNLGGPQIKQVTYPEFFRDGERFTLYLRTGGSGSGDSHFFNYEQGKWLTQTSKDSQFIDRNWSGGDKKLNAYPHSMVIKNGRRHLTWCWRDTPNVKSSHDLCYAYSDDHGKTWLNNDGETIAITGKSHITGDTRSAVVWPIPTGTNYYNRGSMTVDNDGRVHVFVPGEDTGTTHFQRDPLSGQWTRQPTTSNGALIAGPDDKLYIISTDGLSRTSVSDSSASGKLISKQKKYFKDSTLSIDTKRRAYDGWVSAIGQRGKTVTVIDYWISQ